MSSAGQRTAKRSVKAAVRWKVLRSDHATMLHAAPTPQHCQNHDTQGAAAAAELS